SNTRYDCYQNFPSNTPSGLPTTFANEFNRIDIYAHPDDVVASCTKYVSPETNFPGKPKLRKL
ncbi:4669_t:CDS:1, partial [Funneliformis caledonium]